VNSASNTKQQTIETPFQSTPFSYLDQFSFESQATICHWRKLSRM